MLSGVGHEVIVANARQVRLISASSRKDDKLDAQDCWHVWPGWTRSFCRPCGTEARKHRRI